MSTTGFMKYAEGHFTPVDSIKDNNSADFNNMSFNLVNQLKIRFKQDTTLDYFKEQLLKSEDGYVQSVDFYTITGAQIPLCETVSDLNDYPILCQVNEKRIFALNFSQETSIEQIDNKYYDEQKYHSFASGVGLKGYQRFFYGNFSHRLMNALPQKTHLSKTDVVDSIAQVCRYYTDINYQVDGSHTGKNLGDMKAKAVALANEIQMRET